MYCENDNFFWLNFFFLDCKRSPKCQRNKFFEIITIPKIKHIVPNGSFEQKHFQYQTYGSVIYSSIEKSPFEKCKITIKVNSEKYSISVNCRKFKSQHFKSMKLAIWDFSEFNCLTVWKRRSQRTWLFDPCIGNWKIRNKNWKMSSQNNRAIWYGFKEENIWIFKKNYRS